VARSLVRIREAGMTEAMLGVDSDNPLARWRSTSALASTCQRSAAYRKPMEAV
jgi:hypothetical protein